MWRTPEGERVLKGAEGWQGRLCLRPPVSSFYDAGGRIGYIRPVEGKAKMDAQVDRIMHKVVRPELEAYAKEHGLPAPEEQGSDFVIGYLDDKITVSHRPHGRLGVLYCERVTFEPTRGLQKSVHKPTRYHQMELDGADDAEIIVKVRGWLDDVLS